MGRRKKKQSRNNNRKKLRKAQIKTIEARKRLAKLIEVRADMIKRKDPNTWAVVSEAYDKEIADAQRQITKCDQLCTKIIKEQEKNRQVSTETSQVQSSESQMRILSWKTDLQGKALHDKLLQWNADVILLQGTQLDVTALPDGFKSFQKHGMNGAIVLRSCIEAQEINNQFKEMQVQSILIKHTRTPFVISNVLNTATSGQSETLMRLGQIHEMHLIGGDFGALHVKYNCKTTNKAGEMVHKFKALYKYGLINDQAAGGDPEKHDFLLISPQLHPHLWPRHHQIIENGILLTCTVTLAPELPANNQAVARKNKNLTKPHKRQIREEFDNLWETWVETGETQEEGPPFPTDLLSRLLPVAEVDDWLVSKCKGFWKMLVAQKMRWTNKRNAEKPLKRDEWQQVIPAEEMARMARGIVTQVSSPTSGSLYAKDFGRIHIPFEAVVSPDSFFQNLQMHLMVGDRVLFRADLIPTGDCRWTANQVVLDPRSLGDPPNVITDKTGVVTEIGTDGRYALIESREHGIVYCSHSRWIPRVDQVLQVGDIVRFSAHVHPRNTQGLSWLAFSATKLDSEERNESMKQTQQNQLLSQIPNDKVIKEEPPNSVETSEVVVLQKRSTKKRKAPIMIDISDDDVIPEKNIKKEPEDSVPDSFLATNAPPIMIIGGKHVKQEPQDSFPSQETQCATVPTQATRSNKNTFQQQGLNGGQESTCDFKPRTWQTTTVIERGIVLDLSIGYAVVATDKFGVVMCSLSKWFNNNGVGKTTSLLDVIKNGDQVMVTAARNAPTHPWNVMTFHKPP